jgi:hypothetical protein
MCDDISKKDLYKIALDTRNFEISLFWQRSNYFLALNTAIAAGFFFKASKEYQLWLGIFGCLISLLWVSINLGSKFWQSRWENRLKIAEENLDCGINYFSANWCTIKSDVEESIKFSKHGVVRNLVDKFVLLKPSVSFVMILLSLLFVCLWILLTMLSQLFEIV